MNTIHLRERIAERVTDANVSRIIMERIAYAERALSRHGAVAVYIYDDVHHHGDDSIPYRSRIESNGTHFVIIIRNGIVTTGMWRRTNQPRTPDALKVDRVVRYTEGGK